MRLASSIVVALLAGCSSEFVRGGTVSQHELVYQTIDEMELASGYTSAIDSVRFRNVSRGSGKYNSVTRQISLDFALSGDALVKATRHELCHALDFQLGFKSASHQEWRIDAEPLRYGSKRRQAREAFATTCGVAPQESAAILECGTSALDAELRRMLAEVLGDLPLVPRLVPEWTGRTHLPNGESMTFAAITDLGNLWIYGESTLLKTDLVGNDAPRGIGDQIVEPDSAGWEALGSWTFPVEPGSANGKEVGIARRNLLDGSTLQQLMVLNEGEVEGTSCAMESDRWFLWDGDVWLVRQTGPLVEWGRLRD